LDRVGRKTAETIARGRDAVDVRPELDRAAELGVRICCQLDDDYPTLLRHIADPPICLYVRGTLQADDASALGIVGSRRCSHYGQEQARRFGFLAAQAGLTVVSGLAYGIDTFAHYGALDCPSGRTIAAMGCNVELADRIAEAGAVISELPLDTAPDKTNFPGRNRIIAGLSLGTLVIEGTLRSGALITARHAVEYNREVFAIPGRVDSPYAAGPHHLIAQSEAKLVTRAEDVFEELGDVGRRLLGDADVAEAVTAVPGVSPPLDAQETRIVDVLTPDPQHLSELAERSGLSNARVAAAMIRLQLKGVAKQLPGSLYVKVTRS
jgi:DNA processing protein